MDRRGCLSLVSWNCNGLAGRILELREFVKEHNPDILMLQETHLDQSKSCKIPNYTIFRNDFINPNPSSIRNIRGTAICLRNNLNATLATPPPLQFINAVGISLLLSGSPPLTFFSVYVPHNCPVNDIISDIKKLLNYDVNSFLVGDFNAHHPLWNCFNSNTYGMGIYNFLNHSYTDILFPDSPTHYAENSSSTIDFGLFQGFNYDKSIVSLPELSSDHNPIQINIQIRTPPEPHKIITKTNWTQFQNNINALPTVLPNINCTNDIDNLVESITSDITSAIEAATTKKPANEFFKLDPHVRILTKNKNRARKVWQTTRRHTDKIIMNRAQMALKNYLYDKRQESWSNFLGNLTPEDNSIWKAARKFKSSGSKIPPIHIPNSQSYAITDEDKSNAIASNFELQFQGNAIANADLEKRVNDEVRHFLRAEFEPPTFRIARADVYNEIKKLKNRKAPGISGITNEALKNLPTCYIPKITLLINSIFKFNYFPFYWKTAIICPILKPRKPPNLTSSYRPISLLDSLSKLVEVFIARQINAHIEEHNLLMPEQFGFRKNLSAPHQVYRLVEHITTGKVNNQSTAAVFLDIEKAFDKIWINGLIHKLINKNFPPPLIKLIFSYLSDRTFHVKINNSLSRQYPAIFGLPQGSKISPTLFSLFINDMPKYPHTHLAIYADDTCIYSTKHNTRYSISAISHHLKTLSKWFSDWRIAVNVSKTEAILFKNTTKEKRDRHKIKYLNYKLPWLNS